MLASEIDSLDGTHVTPEVLIIDNDPAGGARQVLEELADPRFRYVHEPEPGLSAVRNRALDETSSSRLLAFMDDDGRPAPGWIRSLVDTWRTEQPATIVGRVLEEFETPPDRWITEGGFFRRPSFPTGTEMTEAAAGNLLLDLDDVRSSGVRFNPLFGLTGGEDTLFTRQLTASGKRIVWCDEARVVDQVPTSRLNRKWLRQRAHSHGNSTTLAAITLSVGNSPGPGLVRAIALFKGMVRMVGGAAQYALGTILRSERRQAKGFWTLFRGAGMATGAFGHVVEEYSR